MVFGKNEVESFNLTFKKLEFINIMTMATNYYSQLILDEDNNYFLFMELFHRFKMKNDEFNRTFSTYLKVPVSIPFKKMSGLLLLQKEDITLNAVIQFDKARVAIIDSYGFFYQLEQAIQSTSDQDVAKKSSIIKEYEINEVGYNQLLNDFESKEKPPKRDLDTDEFEKLEKGFLRRAYLIDNYKRIKYYHKRIKRIFR